MTDSPADTSAAQAVPTLAWHRDLPEEPITSEHQLVQRLDAIAAQAGDVPPLVELVMPNGNSLAVGVGRDYSIVSYVVSPAEPDFLSRGDAAGDEPPVFYYGGEYSEFPPGTAVSVDDAYEAMRCFYRTGKQPDNVDWQR